MITVTLSVPLVFGWFDLVSLFNGTSTFVGYLNLKPTLLKNCSDTIQPIADAGGAG